MIQRRQTIYLLLAAIIATVLLVTDLTYFVNSGTLENGETETLDIGYFTTTLQSGESLNNSALIGGLAGYAGLCVITIFMFKNRKRQILAATLGFAMLLFSAVMMYKYSYGAEYFVETGKQELQFTAIIPIALFLLQYLALQGIKRDEALVKSLDRIR